MKYNTRPIDFTGCHPVIAEHLKRGEAIECRVWDTTCMSGGVGFVVGYSTSNAHPYRCDNVGSSIYRHAEPIPSKVKRIMPPERAIPVLIAEGLKFGDSGGDLVGYATSVLIALPFMFKMMGKPLSDPEVSAYAWPPCIIEEMEDNENE